MKKNLFIPAGAIVTCVALFTSCTPYPAAPPNYVPESRQKENLYYVPSAPNTQLLSEKNDMAFDVLASGGSQFSGVETQASYVPGKHVGIIAAYSSAKNDVAETYMRFHKFEAGIGYINPLKNGWHFEAYGGAGTGKIDNLHATGSSTVNLTNFFIQPGLAITNKKKTVQFGIVCKLSGVNFKVNPAFDESMEPFSTSQVVSLRDHPFHVMTEPGFVFRAGWKNFLFHTSYTFSADMSDDAVHGAKDNFSLGASLRFNTAKKVTQ